jgi:hypothetical protein
MLFDCDNHTEHTDTLRGHDAEFWYIQAGGMYSDHWARRGKFDYESREFPQG